MKKMDITEFIDRSKKFHGSKYDYSLTVYVNNKSKVKIICPEHGVFEQRPDGHLRNNGCPKCKTYVRRRNIPCKNISGFKFGKLTAIEELPNSNKFKNRVWVCKCDCGNIKNVSTNNLTMGHTKSCGCNQYKTGKDVYNYTGYEDISGSKWGSIKSGAIIRGLEFLITKEQVWEKYLEQNKKCYFTNQDISFKGKTASIDRLDNSKGYSIDNISIVHKDINIMRNKYSIDYFIEMCNLVSNNMGLINQAKVE